MASNGFRLLVVDGERKSSEQIKSSFEKEGYDVLTSGDGARFGGGATDEDVRGWIESLD